MWKQDVEGGDRGAHKEAGDVAWHQVIQLIPGKSWSVLVRHPGDMVFKIPLGLIALPGPVEGAVRVRRQNSRNS